MKLDHDILVCPECDQMNLHHDRVEVFERAEDADVGVHVLVSGADIAWSDTGERVAIERSVTVDTSMNGNPSSRRHGLLVWFWCECCGHRSRLTIAQHKGSTYVEFKSDRELQRDAEDRELMRGMSMAQRLRFLVERDRSK